MIKHKMCLVIYQLKNRIAIEGLFFNISIDSVTILITSLTFS